MRSLDVPAFLHVLQVLVDMSEVHAEFLVHLLESLSHANHLSLDVLCVVLALFLVGFLIFEFLVCKGLIVTQSLQLCFIQMEIVVDGSLNHGLNALGVFAGFKLIIFRATFFFLSLLELFFTELFVGLGETAELNTSEASAGLVSSLNIGVIIEDSLEHALLNAHGVGVIFLGGLVDILRPNILQNLEVTKV